MVYTVFSALVIAATVLRVSGSTKQIEVVLVESVRAMCVLWIKRGYVDDRGCTTPLASSVKPQEVLARRTAIDPNIYLGSFTGVLTGGAATQLPRELWQNSS